MSANGNGGINVSFNNDMTDAGNSEFDTRAFGSGDEILNGDGTRNGHVKSLSNTVMDANMRVERSKSAINYVRNGFEGKVKYADEKFMKKLDEIKKEAERQGVDPQEEVISWLEKNIDRDQQNFSMFSDKYARASVASPDEKVARYNVGNVPGTNIKVIALFTMNDFNYSDAMKNGTVRQNGFTDSKLGIDKSQRETEKKYVGAGRETLKKLPVTYDDGIAPDIRNNFSLDDTVDGKDHFKRSYDYGDKSYTSVTKLMDKSVMYAVYALKEQDYSPQFIVSAPSSSKFNDYYCNNLANKLGIRYIPDFFKRNVINVQFDEQTENDLERAGASENDKEKVRRAIVNGVYGEIGSYIKNTMRGMLQPYQNKLSNVPLQKYSREKINFEGIVSILTVDLCSMLLQQENGGDNTTTIYRNIIKRYTYGEYKALSNPKINNIRTQIAGVLKKYIDNKFLQSLLAKMDEILKYYSDKIDDGFSVNAQRFKITQIDKRFRNCIHNVYVISDKELNHDNSLRKQYQNSKFLIFDEDINSGATLKLVCDALQDKLENSDDNIICLVNAYSNKGM